MFEIELVDFVQPQGYHPFQYEDMTRVQEALFSKMAHLQATRLKLMPPPFWAKDWQRQIPSDELVWAKQYLFVTRGDEPPPYRVQ